MMNELTGILFRIRISLIISFILIILLLSGSLLTINYYSHARVVEDLSRSYVDKTTNLIELELESFFTPITRSLRQIQKWARSGMVDSSKINNANKLYIPILEAFPQITSISSGFSNGYSYRIGWDKENLLTRLSYDNEAQRETDFSLWDTNNEIIKSWKVARSEYNYDARTRAWYIGANNLRLKSNKSHAQDTPVFWTHPYQFKTSHLPGMSVSLPFRNEHNKTYITTYNVMLSKLSVFTTKLRPSKNGKAFVLTEDGRVIGFPAGEKFNSEEKIKKIMGNNIDLPHVRELDIAELTSVAEAWESHVENKNMEHFRYKSQGEYWWATIQPYKLTESRNLLIGVAVPESDFMGEVKHQQLIILLASAFSFIIAIILAVLLSKSYSRPMLMLVEQSKKITELDLSPNLPIKTHLLETHQLADAHEQMRLGLESFSRYVPISLVKQLLHQDEAAKLGNKSKELTIMFTDIRGFTSISEKMDPDKLAHHLANYFSLMLGLIDDEDGTVDKMIGDAIMAFWGAPISDPAHVYKALTASLTCIERLKIFNQESVNQGLPALETRIGLSTGKVMVGNVGSVDRLNYTVLGDSVNLASRLESVNEIYGTSILVSEFVRDQVRDQFHWRMVDLVAVKGKAEPVRIYEPLGLVTAVPPVSNSTLAFAQKYEKAFSSYLWCDFDTSLALLRELSVEYPNDLSVIKLITSATQFQLNPPGDDWDGVNRLMTK